MSVATFAAAQVLRALPRTRVSRAVGRLCDLKLPAPISRAVVNLYVRAYGVDTEECVPCQGAYPSFDQFFTRELREGRRAIAAGERDVVSPADGKIESLGPIDADGSLLVKQRPYAVSELVGDSADARRYHGGQFAVVYLSPRDYHRVHSPVTGEVTLVRSMPGDLFPVNAIGERHVPTLFSRNRRVAIVIDTKTLGRVTVVMVGAIIVGRITVSVVEGQDVPLGNHVIHPSRAVSKGDEIGIFHLGSTAIVFIEPGIAPPFAPAPRRVRMGESLVGDA